MTHISSSLRELIGIEKEEGEKFCQENGIDGVVDVERIKNIVTNSKDPIINAIPEFESQFGVNLGKLCTVLDRGYSIKTLSQISNRNDQIPLNDILEEIIESPQENITYSFNDENVSQNTILSIMDEEVFSPLRAFAITYEVYGVHPHETLTIPYSESTLSEFINNSMPGITTGSLSIGGSVDGSSLPTVILESDFMIENDTVTFSNPLVGTILNHPVAGAIPMSLELVGVDDEHMVKKWSVEEGEIEVPCRRVAGWIFNGIEWGAVPVEQLAKASSINYDTGDLIVPDEDIRYVDSEDVHIYSDFMEEGEE